MWNNECRMMDDAPPCSVDGLCAFCGQGKAASKRDHHEPREPRQTRGRARGGRATKNIKVEGQHESFLLQRSNKANALCPSSVFAKRLVETSTKGGRRPRRGDHGGFSSIAARRSFAGLTYPESRRRSRLVADDRRRRTAQ